MSEYSKKVTSILRGSNPIKPARKKKKARTIGQDSQRARYDSKMGKKTKKPSARLMKRRSADTVPGYFPNPIKKDANVLIRASMNALANCKDKNIKQVHLSRFDGMTEMAYYLKAISKQEFDMWREMALKIAKA